ncbi:hypothetical protein QNI16_24210 [Cytophagaceae bacterium YF14B1]|uniref:Transporter n=1 Tax=Xanthocytophaga flava TaxID=3048013 RepID=A0AAE3QUR4_9BACT|nr:hypothetical protein [Xanthocytophaga flavus]MDJ1483625.1 hypothetical protein [Xanthocytophaga flavus]
MKAKVLFFVLLLLPTFWSTSYGQFFADLETGIVFSSPYNQVRAPGKTGTQIDLTKDLQLQKAWFYRVRLGYTLGKRHKISLLAAPLSVKSDGTLDKNVSYNGELYQQGKNTEGTFMFDTYRFTYAYEIIHSNRFRLGVGATALLRNASVRLQNPTTNTAYDNRGIVPLLHYDLWWNPTRRLLILSEADGSYANAGQAFDVFAGIGYRFTPIISAKAGYRVIQGGTRGDNVYISSWLDFASVGLTIDWRQKEDK